MFILQMLNLRLYLIGVLLIILSFNLIKFLWKRRYWYYYSSKMDGPFNWPMVGYGWKFLGNNQDMYNVFDNFCKFYKTPAALWVGPHLHVAITDPRHYEVILNRTLNKLHILYDFVSEVIGTGILTAPANKWKRHRKLIQPTFNNKILNSFVEIFSCQSKDFVRDLDKYVGKGFFDSFPVFSKLTMSLVCGTIMGNVILTKEQISDCHGWVNTSMDLLYYRAFKIWFHSSKLWNLTTRSKTLNKCTDNLNQLVKKIIIQKRKEYKSKIKREETEEYNNGEDKSRLKGFLDYVIEISEESGQLTNDELVEEAAVLLVGGTDTIATTNSFCLLILGLHPEIQNKVYDELYSIFDDSDRPAEVEDLNKMVYLERVIKETMRLYPPLPFVGRNLDTDIQLDSNILPKGSSCVLLISQTHRDPEIWDNPLEFDPDRFLPEEIAKRHPYAFIPFSAGPRNCIGLIYAMKAIKVILSTMLRTYKVSTNYKTISDIKLSQAIVLRCADGANISLEYRN